MGVRVTPAAELEMSPKLLCSSHVTLFLLVTFAWELRGRTCRTNNDDRDAQFYAISQVAVILCN